jgi:hypothetical protein
VTLTATPVGGSALTGWSGGGCSGTGACQVTMDQARAVTATFTKLTGALYYPLTPCRVVDTRSGIDPAAVKRGMFTDGEIRAYTFSTSTECPGLPSTAKAWVVHLSFRTLAQAAYLTVYPAGATQPLASTLLGYTAKWNGDNAVISAGSGATIDLFAQYSGNVIIDVNGYFK